MVQPHSEGLCSCKEMRKVCTIKVQLREKKKLQIVSVAGYSSCKKGDISIYTCICLFLQNNAGMINQKLIKLLSYR